jgi:hypothetical protein
MRNLLQSLIQLRPARVCLLASVLLVSLATLGVAQTEFSIGSIVKKFELPQRDKEGNLTLTIFGREATVISLNRIKVDGLKIEIFRSGKVETVMTAPSCDFWKQEGRLTTEAGVTVEHPNFHLTADEMNWELTPSRGDFKNNVQLRIKQAPELK